MCLLINGFLQIAVARFYWDVKNAALHFSVKNYDKAKALDL
jgi:hypothetical protein